MALKDPKRLNMVLPYLYPDLTNNGTDTGDYMIMNSELVWQTEAVTAPTEQQIADAKEAAVDAWWWKRLRIKRNFRLVQSDWSQGADVPSAIKTAWATYRQELRELPTTVTKPSFETLSIQSDVEWNIKSLMPTKPED